MKKIFMQMLSAFLSKVEDEPEEALVVNGDLMEVTPTNYNPELKQGSFTGASVLESKGVNGENVRSNVVGSYWSYNSTAGGGAKIKGEASYRFAGETFYKVGDKELMEFHSPEIVTTQGLSFRPWSIYADRNTGETAINSQVQQVNYKNLHDGNIDWYRVVNDAGNIRVLMQPEKGGSYLEMNAVTPQGNNKSYLVNGGNGFAFYTTFGGFEFNKGANFGGNISAQGVTINNQEDKANPFSVKAKSTANRIAFFGDETHPEKFAVLPAYNFSATPMFMQQGFHTGGPLIKIGSVVKVGWDSYLNITVDGAPYKLKLQ